MVLLAVMVIDFEFPLETGITGSFVVFITMKFQKYFIKIIMSEYACKKPSVNINIYLLELLLAAQIISIF